MGHSFLSGLVLYVAAVLPQGAFAQQYVQGEVTHISDGDTINVQPDGTYDRQSVLKIRTIGIDAPEQHLPTDHGMVGQEDWGTRATEYLNTILHLGDQVLIENHGFDHYHRTLGRIYLNNRDINYLMVRAGWAIPYIICSGVECRPGYLEHEHVQEYFEACEAARSEGKGVFDRISPLAEMPFEFRLRMQHRTPDKYVGDFNTRVLYAPSDYNQVDVCRRVFFMNLTEAQGMGFSQH